MGKLEIKGFTGMDNITGGLIKENILIPQFVINALPSSTLRLTRREGSVNKITLANSHSMWSGSIILCVADSVLYQLDLVAESSTSLGSVEGKDEKMYYVEIGNVIYLSNKYWCSALENSTLRTWGQSVIDEEAKTWLKHENGSEFFERGSSFSGPGFTPRSSEFLHAAKPMNYITEAFGRIWGAIGSKLVYSDPATPEWFQNDINVFDFTSEIKMIAKDKASLYIGFDNKTAIMTSGSAYDSAIHPDKMDIRYVNKGVIEHTMQYCDFSGELGYNIPTWLSPSGVMIGSDGSIIDISGGKVKYDIDTPIGSGFYMYKGEPLYIATMLHKEDRVVADEATHNWIIKNI